MIVIGPNGEVIREQLVHPATGNTYPLGWLLGCTDEQRAELGVTLKDEPPIPDGDYYTYTDDDAGNRTVQDRPLLQVKAVVRRRIRDRVDAVFDEKYSLLDVAAQAEDLPPPAQRTAYAADLTTLLNYRQTAFQSINGANSLAELRIVMQNMSPVPTI